MRKRRLPAAFKEKDTKLFWLGQWLSEKLGPQQLRGSFRTSLGALLFSFVVEHSPYSPAPSPSPSFFFFPPILPSLTHSSIQGDASPSHPAPFNSVHCVHFIPAPIPRIFRILGETLHILRTQRARSFIKPKARGVPGVGGGLLDAVATPIRGKVWELIHKEAHESRPVSVQSFFKPGQTASRRLSTFFLSFTPCASPSPARQPYCCGSNRRRWMRTHHMASVCFSHNRCGMGGTIGILLGGVGVLVVVCVGRGPVSGCRTLLEPVLACLAAPRLPLSFSLSVSHVQQH
ncbi:hypothetical protein Q8A73_004977 [Channa argus]|nr:hypothetical protein Q8A73_004977 [Channa argus]